MHNLMVSRPELPIGVRVIAMLTAIQGIISAIIGLFVLAGTFAAHHVIGVHGHRILASFVGLFGTVVGGGILLEGVLALVFAWGLWTLQRWAFWATIVISTLMLIFNIFALIRHSGSVTWTIIDMILPVVILLYFIFDPHVRRAFHID